MKSLSKFQFGIDQLLADQALLAQLKKSRVAALVHPASVTRDLTSTWQALCSQFKLSAGFGPQHGFTGEKQENMIESQDTRDFQTGLPVFSLYGESRRLTPKMREHFDILLFDLQDIGCRIYTYLSTLIYLLEDLADSEQELWVLDRPNPVGRGVEGQLLQKAYFSFVGLAEIPMRHGLTLGELAIWYCKKMGLSTRLKVIPMSGYDPREGPGFGWPHHQVGWVNPSPNIPRLTSCRPFCGTVLLEGTTLSEGRGTTRPLEVLGAPQHDPRQIMKVMNELAPQVLAGSVWRPYSFEPVFHKHAGQLCHGFQIHTDTSFYRPEDFKPLRAVAVYLKAVAKLYGVKDLWRMPPYEYEEHLMPIDILSGDSFIREWVEHPQSSFAELDAHLAAGEIEWAKILPQFYLYS